jgi:hypothetical protein
MLQFQIREADGSLFFGSTLISLHTKHVVILFKDLLWAPWSPATANGRLQTDKLAQLLFGLGGGDPGHEPEDQNAFEISNIQAVKFAP